MGSDAVCGGGEEEEGAVRGPGPGLPQCPAEIGLPRGGTDGRKRQKQEGKK